VFAGGCTVGAFFVPVLHASPAGFLMLFGLMIGAVIGLKLLMWTLENITWGMQAPASKTQSTTALALYPWLGLALITAILWWATSWYGSEDSKLASRAIIVIAGFAIGFIMHRSRFCVARAVREPFMTAEGDMTKAVILALAIGHSAEILAWDLDWWRSVWHRDGFCRRLWYRFTVAGWRRSSQTMGSGVFLCLDWFHHGGPAEQSGLDSR
jgi:uncharacterized metal-binding protein